MLLQLDTFTDRVTGDEGLALTGVIRWQLNSGPASPSKPTKVLAIDMLNA